MHRLFSSDRVQNPIRAKRNTKKQVKPIVVSVNDYAYSILKKYPSRTGYLFPFINPNLDTQKQYEHKKAFTKRLNKQLKKIAKTTGLPEKLSFYWCRHTYATISITKHGASMEQMMEALNHSSMETTKKYFAGFNIEAKKALADKLMNFD